MDTFFTVKNESTETELVVNSSALQKQPKPVYWEIPQEPVMEGPDGIRYDFNCGIRVLLPEGNKKYRVIFLDQDTDTVMHDAEVTGGTYITGIKKFFINYKLTITEKNKESPIMVHCYNAYGKLVVISFPEGAIGDSIGWFSYVDRFRQKHHCKLVCVVPSFIKELFQKQYQDIELLTAKEAEGLKPYATYYMGLFFGGDTDWQPVDFRQVGLHKTAAHILNVSDEEIPPKADLTRPSPVQGKYCVISTQASSQTKHWNNPFGWDETVQFLKANGYKVCCINKDRNYGSGLIWNHIPYGVEDFTGDRPLQERIDLIKDADFFIGLSSGLSWLAWCCKVPIVLISGFSLPSCEFYTPYRVINYNVCTGCWDDRKENFDHSDFLWCPRHRGTPRQFECTFCISSKQVVKTIKKIPSFKPLNGVTA